MWGGARLPFAAAYGLAPVGVLSLLLVAAQAATSITSERDIGALDLLLVTDLTPQEFIFGKLGGVMWNTKEFLIPPLVLAGIYAWLGPAGGAAGRPHGAGRVDERHGVGLRAGRLAGADGVRDGAGPARGARNQNSGTAVVLTLGTVFFLSLGTLFCWR